jgi:NADPH-dependent 2,4-dienoyl-CoA reductase/sulfur reductase-like enzyme/nitrite reductase/ring-hydroxylating ferredoxin subunit
LAESGSASGSDFSQGIKLDEIPSQGTIAGRVGDEPVLLSRLGGELFAIGATCTHYGGNLGDGLSEGTTVRCPLHHACFDLRTGAVLRAPALDPVDRWQVEVEGDRVFVRHRIGQPEAFQSEVDESVRNIVIIGGGAAGLACANELRRRGFSGAITMLSADLDPPCDRPNLSKDYLAGHAPEQWLWLRGEGWYAKNRIDLQLSTEVTRIDPEAQTVHCASGEEFAFDRLLIAIGAEPNRLDSPGLDLPNVHTLRSVRDARALAEQAHSGARAVIIGASFIGLEAAAALRQCEVAVDIVSVEEIPLEHVFGRDLGLQFKALHEREGVRFHLSCIVESFDGNEVELGDGERIAADFVLVAIGVRPNIALAQSAGATVKDGVLVDACLQTSQPGIYAAGDIAAYPEPISGETARIEHWVVAERQGEVAAANMLGANQRFQSAPFFWTEQYGVPVRFVGRASGWDAVTVEGDIESGSLVARYFIEGTHCATATLGRDRVSLEDELALEQSLGVQVSRPTPP